jgi:hypothetical protein
MWNGLPGGLLPTATKFPFESIISATTLIRFWVIASEKVSECLLSLALVNCKKKSDQSMNNTFL